MNVQVLVTEATEIPALQDEGGVFMNATDMGSEESLRWVRKRMCWTQRTVQDWRGTPSR